MGENRGDPHTATQSHATNTLALQGTSKHGQRGAAVSTCLSGEEWSIASVAAAHHVLCICTNEVLFVFVFDDASVAAMMTTAAARWLQGADGLTTDLTMHIRMLQVTSHDIRRIV